MRAGNKEKKGEKRMRGVAYDCAKSAISSEPYVCRNVSRRSSHANKPTPTASEHLGGVAGVAATAGTMEGTDAPCCTNVRRITAQVHYSEFTVIQLWDRHFLQLISAYKAHRRTSKGFLEAEHSGSQPHFQEFSQIENC